MKKISGTGITIINICISAFIMVAAIGCANMIPPTGGLRDSLPPVLVSALPKDSAINFKADRITLNFNEYIEVQNIFENVLVSPTPTNIPVINYHFRTITIKIKDTLEPNTTYSINFGNSIRDINEGNIFKEFTYLFSTGSTLDGNSVYGKVIMAETGKVDSTLIVVLHRNRDDSAVAKEKPRYIAKLDGNGNFKFKNLPADTFAMYAIANEFSHKYEDTTKPFAFADKLIISTDSTPTTLFAYTLDRIDTTPVRKLPPPKENSKVSERDKLLRYQTSLQVGRQDVLKNLELTFNRPLAVFDSTKILLTDKDLKPVGNYSIKKDTSNTRITITYNWPLSKDFNLLIDTSAFVDSAGINLVKNDTIKFETQGPEDYGSVRLRFKNLDYTKNPVLQIVQNDKIVDSIPLTQREWYRKLFEPGEYELRILYDSNKNGTWDPGRFFGFHLQPEIVITLKTTLAVRANWDNEKDITL